MNNTPVVKDENTERAVPTDWRQSLKTIADAFVSGQLPNGKGIRTVEADTLSISIGNIKDYPDILRPLAENCWETSVYIWTGTHWDVLVDLISEDGETTDLVMHVQVYEVGQCYEFQPYLIYVP